MIAALDATPLSLTSGGLPRYVAELSHALATQFPEDTYALLSDQQFRLPANSPSNLIEDPAPQQDRRWWLRGVRKAIQRTDAQVFHGTNFEVPYLGNTPAILTIHDLSPWKDPAWHAGADRVRRRTPWLIRLCRAQRILTVSEAMRREIIAHFRVPGDQVRAIPLAASPLFRPVQHAPPQRPYFLFVGTLEPRKNIPALVEAWRETRRETGADLLIAGRTRADFPHIPATDGMQYLGEIPDAELPGLYSSALAFVYPTRYEGFGLPVLEAMQCGCPVVTSHDPAVTEVAGDAAIHAGSTHEIAQALIALAGSPRLQHEMNAKGLARVRQYSWEHTARKTRALYQEVLNGARV